MRSCKHLLFVALGGLSLAACESTGDQQLATCYGVTSASREMHKCATTTQVTLRQYQAQRQATQNQVAREARDACLSYGLDPGSALYRNCLVREADLRGPINYASHFDQPGFRYDQNGHRVDDQDYLIDRSGRRMGGKGYWIKGPGDNIVPPGTYIGATAPAIQASPARR